MKKKIRGISLSVILALTTVLSACGGGNNQTSAPSSAPVSQPASTNSSEASATPQEDITLKFISWWSYISPEIIKTFEEENPGIKIDYEYVAPGDGYVNKVKALSATGDLPDVFAVQHPNLNPLVQANQIMDLKNAFDTAAYDKETSWKDTMNLMLVDKMNASFEKEADAENHLWAVPFGAIAIAVVYNKTMFDQYGLKAPTTWEEFESNNKTLLENDIIPMSYAGKIGWSNWWVQLLLDQTARDITPNDFVTGKAKITDQPFVDVLEQMKKMWADKTFDPNGLVNGIEETQALFVQQKLAQYLVVPENFVKYLVDNSPEGVELAAYEIPAWKGVEPARTVGGAANLAAVSADTKHPEAAVKLTKFLTSEKVFQMLSKEDVVPSTKGYTPPEGDAIMGVYANAIEKGFLSPHLPAGQDAQNKLKEMLPQVLVGKVTTEEALKEVQKVIDKTNAK